MAGEGWVLAGSSGAKVCWRGRRKGRLWARAGKQRSIGSYLSPPFVFSTLFVSSCVAAEVNVVNERYILTKGLTWLLGSRVP